MVYPVLYMVHPILYMVHPLIEYDGLSVGINMLLLSVCKFQDVKIFFVLDSVSGIIFFVLDITSFFVVLGSISELTLLTVWIDFV